MGAQSSIEENVKVRNSHVKREGKLFEVLPNNDLSPEGIVNFLQSHSDCEFLYLSGANCKDEGFRLIAKAFRDGLGNLVKVLDVSNCGLTDKSAQLLASAISSNPELNLQEIYIEHNKIHDEGALAILSSCEDNMKMITKLSFEGNPISQNISNLAENIGRRKIVELQASSKNCVLFDQKHLEENMKTFMDAKNNSLYLSPNEVREVLTSGDLFVKYKYGQIKNRYVWCDDEMEKLCWNAKKLNSVWIKGFVWLKDIESIRMSHSDCISEDDRFRLLVERNPDICLSITTATRTLDLEARTVHVRDRFAISLIIRRLELQVMGNSEYNNENETHWQFSNISQQSDFTETHTVKFENSKLLGDDKNEIRKSSAAAPSRHKKLHQQKEIAEEHEEESYSSSSESQEMAPPQTRKRKTNLMVFLLEQLDGNENSLEAFKKASSMFGQGEVTTKQYWEFFVKIFDAHKVAIVFPEIIKRIKDEEEIEELNYLYKKHMRKLKKHKRRQKNRGDPSKIEINNSSSIRHSFPRKNRKKKTSSQSKQRSIIDSQPKDNSNGQITYKEFCSLLDSMPDNYEALQKKKLFTEIDKDNDFLISWDEFTNYFLDKNNKKEEEQRKKRLKEEHRKRTISNSRINDNVNNSDESEREKWIRNKTEQFEITVKKWVRSSGKLSGKYGDIRIMLTTLHQIFPFFEPPDKFCVDFDASPAKISKVMRKSKAVLHPDKYTSAENKEIQILANIIFSNVNSAFSRFETWYQKEHGEKV